MFSKYTSLLQEFIKYQSITHQDDGQAICFLERTLTKLGFACYKKTFVERSKTTHNLYAEYGAGKRNLCFAGHADVVPPGDLSLWNHDPFSATEVNGMLYGRGMVDMKGAIICFVAAFSQYLKAHPDSSSYKFSLLISGDEEDDSKNGMIKMLNWLQENQFKIDHCIVGEPTNTNYIGEAVKIGRRGSINFSLNVEGKQGHVAYPQLALNPVHKIIEILQYLKQIQFDKGSAFFSPSNLEITNIEVGNNTTNLIPAKAKALFNVRFNDLHTSTAIICMMQQQIEQNIGDFAYQLDSQVTAEAFYNREELLRDIVAKSIFESLGVKPEFNTLGGTSDARFICKICPVVEFGLTNKTAHHSNECSSLEDLDKLTRCYYTIIKNYFA